HVRHGFQLLGQYPILQGLQIHHVVSRIGTLQREEINLPHRTVIRTNGRLQPVWQIHLRQLFQNLLPVQVIARPVVEHHHHARQPEQRYRTQRRQLRQPIHLRLNRNRNLLLHFLGSAPRPLRDHLDIIIGYVRISLHRQRLERNSAPDQQQDADSQNQEPVAQRKIDRLLNHL